MGRILKIIQTAGVRPAVTAFVYMKREGLRDLPVIAVIQWLEGEV